MSKPKMKMEEDVIPLSEFRANSATHVEQVRTTKRHKVITQHGKAAAILLDPGVFDAMEEELEMLRDLVVSEEELKAGEGIEHDAVIRDVLESLPS